MNPFLIAPSILSADLARLGPEVDAVLKAGADWIHVDIMDNHYVPNLSFGPDICSALRKFGVTVPLDVHLMINPVDNIIPQFAKAGASIITFHPDATDNIANTIALIKKNGCQACLAFKPDVPIDILPNFLDQLDMVLIMSVHPGFAGQKFIPNVLPKIKAARDLMEKHHRKIRIEVDGGIDVDNIADVAKAGADTFVAGSAIFKSKDYASVLRSFKEKITASIVAKRE